MPVYFEGASDDAVRGGGRQADVHDKRLWTAVSRINGAAGNFTALVGSHEQVAESLIDYVDVGGNDPLIRGYDPLADAVNYGRLVQLVHAELATRSTRTA